MIIPHVPSGIEKVVQENFHAALTSTLKGTFCLHTDLRRIYSPSQHGETLRLMLSVLFSCNFTFTGSQQYLFRVILGVSRSLKPDLRTHASATSLEGIYICDGRNLTEVVDLTGEG